MTAPLLVPSVTLRRYSAVEASDVHDFHQIVLGLDKRHKNVNRELCFLDHI